MCNPIQNLLENKARCSCCKLLRFTGEFNKDTSNLYGVNAICKQCRTGLRQLKYFDINCDRKFRKWSRELIDGKCECPGCNQLKNLCDFHKSSSSKLGIGTYCKSCKNKKDKKYRDTHPDYNKLSRECRKRNQQKFLTENKELSDVRLKIRSNYKFKNKYGITTEEYLDLYKKQNGKCAICKKPETGKTRYGTDRPLCVDHDHKTNKVRGLLCNLCNQGIGCLKDDVDILKNALNYIEIHNNC